MMKFTRKQAFAVALSAVFSLAVFSAPLIYATEMPIASAPTESTEPVAPSEPPPAVSETPVVSTPEVSDPTGGVSVPPVVSGEPGGTESGGIEPLPDGSSAPSSEPEGQTSEPASSETVSSEEPVESQPQTITPSRPEYIPPVINNPDTDQDLIDQLASHAATANSDPDVLTSQDWSELLSQAGSDGSSSDSSSAGGAVLPTDDDTNGPGDMTTSSRSSWLLPVGIVMILLAFAGFAVFVYLQFIAPRMKASSAPSPAPLTGGRTDPSVEPMTDLDGSGVMKVNRPGDKKPEQRLAPEKATPEQQAFANQETMEISAAGLRQPAPQRPQMEDIFSSDETEKIVREGGARQAQPPQAHSAAAPTAKPAASPQNPAPTQAAVPSQTAAPAKQSPAAPSSAKPLPKAQATPVSPEAAKSFDWDKFFEE